MLWVIRGMMFTGYAALSVLLILGAADLTARRWQRAAGEMIAGIIGFIAGVVLLRSASSAFAASITTTPEEGAQVLAATLSTTITWSIAGFAAGTFAGVYLARRRRTAEQAR